MIYKHFIYYTILCYKGLVLLVVTVLGSGFSVLDFRVLGFRVWGGFGVLSLGF